MSSKTSREEIINQQWEICIELSLRQIYYKLMLKIEKYFVTKLKIIIEKTNTKNFILDFLWGVAS